MTTLNPHKVKFVKPQNHWSLEFWNTQKMGWVHVGKNDEKVWGPLPSDGWKTSINATPYGTNPYPTVELALQALAYEQTVRRGNVQDKLCLNYRIHNTKTGEIIPGEIFV